MRVAVERAHLGSVSLLHAGCEVVILLLGIVVEAIVVVTNLKLLLLGKGGLLVVSEA
jgi:hypothetical protein